METLRKQLDAECGYRMKDETMDRFLGLMTELELKKGEPLIDYGECNTNIYIVKKGIIRNAWFDGFKEVTFAFSLPGTLLMSYYTFVKGNPAFSKLEACCPTVVMKIPQAKFYGLIRESHDFAQWMFSMSLEQLFYYEMKREIVNGDAKERFESLLKNRPEIIDNVSLKIIASYIGITPEYLSKLKREHKIFQKNSSFSGEPNID